MVIEPVGLNMIWMLAIVAIVLMLGSGLCTTAEAATFGVGSSRLRTLEEEGFRGAAALADLRGRSESVRATLLLLNCLLQVVAVGTLVILGGELWQPNGTWFGLLIGAVAVLVFGQGLPRFIAAGRPIRIALASAPTLIVVERIVRTLASPFSRIGLLFLGEDRGGNSTREERNVRELTELGQEEGLVGEDEHLLVERVFRLDELTAWDVMTPRVDIFAWRDFLTLAEIIGELKTVPYSRVPVYKESMDDISGILYVREAYERYVAGHTTTTLAQLSRDPLFIPGSMPLTRLLRHFQAKQIHIGIIADEFGGTDGLVTLEDILEELVGEIVDETDVAEETLVRVSRTQVVARGGIDLREINHAFNVALPQLEHRSLNGFILEEFGHVPTAGESLEHTGVRIEILEASDTQVTRARLTKLTPLDREEPA